jgi:hypothetical protein
MDPMNKVHQAKIRNVKCWRVLSYVIAVASLVGMAAAFAMGNLSVLLLWAPLAAGIAFRIAFACDDWLNIVAWEYRAYGEYAPMIPIEDLGTSLRALYR